MHFSSFLHRIDALPTYYNITCTLPGIVYKDIPVGSIEIRYTINDEIISSNYPNQYEFDLNKGQRILHNQRKFRTYYDEFLK